VEYENNCSNKLHTNARQFMVNTDRVVIGNS